MSSDGYIPLTPGVIERIKRFESLHYTRAFGLGVTVGLSIIPIALIFFAVLGFEMNHKFLTIIMMAPFLSAGLWLYVRCKETAAERDIKAWVEQHGKEYENEGDLKYPTFEERVV